MPGTPFTALLAGGGTGGHVIPALSLADELRDRGWKVSFVGSAAGVEARLVPARGIDFHTLPARPLVGQGMIGRLSALATLARSGWQARGLVRRLGADVVVGTGGYVSAPAVVGAWLARRPVLLLEPNAHTGVANRTLSRLAAGAAVAYEETTKELHCPSWVTGTPVRREFFEIPDLAPPWTPLRLLVLGGSQGAQQINESVPSAVAEAAASLPELRVLHQCGERHLDATRETYEELRRQGRLTAEVDVTPFLDDVAGAMAESHLIVSRAGALTLAEICAAGRPSLLIPLAHALGHQGDNARILENRGAAEVLGDGGRRAAADARPLSIQLAERISALLGTPEKLQQMGQAARQLAGGNASKVIADRLEEWARRRRS